MYRRLLTAMLFLFLSACSFQSDESEIRKTISEMVALIDAGQEQKLFSEYAYFEVVKETPPEIKMPDSTRQTLRFALIRDQELTPIFSENNTLAVYESSLFDRPMWFVKQQGKWRMMDGKPNKAN